jgi:tripartite-type tricarboxylate transporter receptor subunit TctC
VLALPLTALPTLPALAQAPAAWPSRAVRILVAYPPGGVSDDIMRALAEKLSTQLGVPVLAENRAGAGGSVAMDALAKAPADGYTLCFSAITPLTLLPLLGSVNYDPVRDIAPVASVMLTPVLIVGTSALPARTLPDALAAARERPGSLRWATTGLGTTGHMVLEQVRKASGTDITHIPYKGGGQQITDALSGQFELLSTNVGALQLQHIKSGKFKPLAVGADKRVAVLPDVPTLAELGFAQANLVSLFGLFAPGGTPPSIVQRLNTEINKALQLPEIRRRLEAVNNVPAVGDVAGFARYIEQDALRSRRALMGSEAAPALR